MEKALLLVRWSDDPEGENLYAGELPTVPSRGEWVHIERAPADIIHTQVDTVIHILKDRIALVLLRRPSDVARRRAPLAD